MGRLPERCRLWNAADADSADKSSDGQEPGVSRSNLPLASPVQPGDEAPHDVAVATRGDTKEFEHSSQKVANVPSAIHVFAETFMPGSWFPRLQISGSSMSSSSTLRFRPLTSDVMDLANFDQRSSASSKFLTTADDAVPSVDPREPLSARSSALNDDFLREFVAGGSGLDKIALAHSDSPLSLPLTNRMVPAS